MADAEHRIQLTAAITEIAAADEWHGDDIHVLPDIDGSPMDLQEMTQEDESPFCVNLVILREGPGRGKPRAKWYSAQAVRDTARLAPGLLGFLGHQQPKNRDHEYRQPQMKIIAARVDTVFDDDGQPRLVARAKGYVSRMATELRSHIREGMAGPVSIDGKAVLRMREDGTVEVAEMLSLRCIDFCNPGTEGIQGAGVESVVSEMAASDHQERSQSMSNTRLSREQLLAEYGAEVREIAREQADELSEPLQAQVAEMQQATEKLQADLVAREVEVAEMSKELAELRQAMAVRELKDFRGQALAELARRENLSEQVQEMIARDVPTTLLDDDADLAHSKEALRQSLESRYATIKEVAEISGGSLCGRTQPRAAGGNPPREDSRDDQRELAGAVLARADTIYGKEQ